MRLSISALCAYLLTYWSADAAWSSCTPQSSHIKCEVSDQLADNDCSGHGSNLANQPVIPKVIDLHAEPFRIRGNDYNSADITWRSANALALNTTTGFLLKLYRHQSPRTGELCRHLRVSSSLSTVSREDAEVVFTYTVEHLEAMDLDYSVEIVSLPYSSVDGFEMNSKYFHPSSSITPPPEDYLSVMNLTYDVSKPYTLSGGFRRASSFPSLQTDDKQDIYKYSHYKVLLLRQDGSLADGITNASNTSRDNIASEGDPYAHYTLNGLIPGKYQLQVRPFSSCPVWDTNCFPAPDGSSINKADVVVRGMDYRPSKPELTISPTHNITVSFQVAPSDHYIVRYFVNLYVPDGGEQYEMEVLPTPEARNSWYRHEFLLSTEKAELLFNVEELIVAEVIPQLESSLCPNRSQCNLDGTCIPCTRSISLGQIFPDIPATTPTTSAVSFVWITAAVIPILLITTLIVLIAICKRKGMTSTDVLKAVTICIARKPQNSQPHPEEMTLTKVKVCIAAVAGSQYKEFNTILRSVLEHHFNCEVDIYNGDPSNPDVYKQCDYVIVVYSPELRYTYGFLQQFDTMIPKEQQQQKAVLDLLLKPQPTCSPSVMFLAFENVTARYINDLVSGNSSLKVFKLPTDWKLMVAELHNAPNSQSMKDSMEYFEDGALKERMDSAVDNIISELDSGLGGLEYETETVCTGAQNDDRFGSGYANMHSTTPRADEQRFLPDRQESVDPSPSAPPQFPTFADPSVTGYTDVVEPASIPQPNHMVVDETKGVNGTHLYDTVSVDSGSACQRGSNDCESVPSSEDSIIFSTFTSSVLPGSSGVTESSRQTFDC